MDKPETNPPTAQELYNELDRWFREDFHPAGHSAEDMLHHAEQWLFNRKQSGSGEPLNFTK